MLVQYFSSLYSADVRHGISAATHGLNNLMSMDGFRPPMADIIINQVSKIGDDFRMQSSDTRVEVYNLLEDLLKRQEVQNLLAHQYTTGEFILPLLQLAKTEKAPQGLIAWFRVVELLLAKYTLSTEVAEAIFDSFSIYFPITISGAAINPGGISPDQLKQALRTCFSGSEQIAHKAFPFLLQRLDSGDAVTANVKVSP